jgi:hypothetical protein
MSYETDKDTYRVKYEVDDSIDAPPIKSRRAAQYQHRLKIDCIREIDMQARVVAAGQLQSLQFTVERLSRAFVGLKYTYKNMDQQLKSFQQYFMTSA